MAGPGRVPKENLSRESDTKRRDANIIKVSQDGVLRGFPLPKDAGFNWHPRTKVWWQTWRQSPMAQTFTETDFLFLLDCAFLHHKMWTDDQVSLAAEIRLRVSAFGGTPEARLRLKLKITDDAAEIATTVSMDVERRKRLQLLSE